jgi:hypothetical protein
MKKLLGLLGAAVVAGTLAIHCSEESEVNPTDTDTDDPVATEPTGTWEDTIPKLGDIIESPILVRIAFAEDSTYLMMIREEAGTVDDDTLFLQRGTWSLLGSDSITMAGTQCLVIDTTPAEDTLQTLPDSSCRTPATLPAPIQDPWYVVGGDLGSTLDVFPVPAANRDFIEKFKFSFVKIDTVTPKTLADTSGPSPTTADGDWTYTLPAIDPWIPTPIEVRVSLAGDSSSALLVREASETSDNATLYTQTGTWSVLSADSIAIVGAECSMLDTSTGDLQPVPDSICTQPITLPYPKTDPWTVKVGDLGPALDAFPIQPSSKEMVKEVEVALTKE